MYQFCLISFSHKPIICGNGQKKGRNVEENKSKACKDFTAKVKLELLKKRGSDFDYSIHTARLPVVL